VTLTAVTVTDPLLTVVGGPITLAPGATDSTTFTGTYALTQVDIDAGSRANTATAIGTPPSGPPVTGEGGHATPIPASPLLTVDKVLTGNADEDISGTVSLGDTLSYTVTATNTGNVTLTNVVVSDDLTATSTTCATVAPGATCVLLASYMVTQADVDAGQVMNIGEADSDETPPVTDPNTVPVPQPAELQVVKALTSNSDEDSSGSVTVNDTLNYTITATNTGTVTLTNVVVSDSLTGTNTTCLTVAPGATCVLLASYGVTQVDVDAGQVVNTGTADSDETDPVTDPYTEPVPQTPGIAVVKAGTLDLGGDGVATPGDVISYTFTVINTGNVTLTGVTVTDPLLTVVGGPITLASGATDSTTFTGTYALTQADIDAGGVVNTATGTGTPPTGPPVTGDGGHTTPIPLTPGIAVVKAGTLDLGGDGVATVGDVISYTFTVTNTGNLTLTGVTVTDPLLTVVGGPITLAPGATDSTTFTGTYALTQADIEAGSRVNTATATGTPPSGPPVTGDDTHTTPVPQAPAFELTKAVDKATAVPGETLVYTLSYANTGNVSVSGVEITDVVPALTTFASASGGGTEAAGVVTWSLGTIAAGASGSVTLTVTLDAVFPAGTTPVTNLAVVVGDPPLPPVPPTPPVTTVVTAGPELMLTKSVDKPTATPGETLVYTLSYSNTGNADAMLTAITDAVPAFTTFASASDGGTEAAGVVTWSLGTIAAGASGSVTLTVTLDSVFPAGTTTVTNSAVVVSPDNPPVPPTPDVPTVVTAGPELTLTKSVDKATALPGETLVYTLSYSNTGDADATATEITDAVPAFTTFASASGGGTEAAGVVTWSLGTVAAGGSGSVTLTVTIDPTFLNGTVTNSAVVSSPDQPGCTTCTTPDVPTEVASPSLTITKTVSDAGPVLPGTALTYTVTVSNSGTVAATGVVIDDLVPANTTFASATGSPTTAPGAGGTGPVQWTGLTVAGSGGTEVVTLTVTVDPTFLNGTVTNSAVVSSPDQPGCTTCTTPDVPTEVASPSLTLTKTVDNPGPVLPGAVLTYTVTVTNSGTVAATGVTIVDVVPANTTFAGASAGGTHAAGVVTWNLGTVPGGGSPFAVTLKVTVDPTFLNGTVTNSAVVSSPDQPDCTTACTTPDVPTEVASPDLTITKTVDKATAAPGETLTYTVTVTNSGTVAATGVSISDLVPTLTTFASATGSPTTAPTVGGTGLVEWTGLTVAGSGGTEVVTLAVTLDAVFPMGTTTVLNSAVAASPDQPGCTTCTTPDVPTVVTAGPELTLTKSVDKATATPGETLVYTLSYSNTGTADATLTEITDAVPALTTFASASDGGTEAAGVVTWSLGTVAAGASGSVTLTVTLDGVFPVGETTVTNSAVVVSPDNPPVPPTPDVPTVVTAGPELTLTKSVDKATASPGETLVYTLSYSNAGNADATLTEITDAVPAFTTFASASDGGTEAAGVVTWSLGTVAAGASGSVTLTVTLDGVFPVGETTVTNSAVVVSPDNPPVPPTPDVPTVVTAGPELTLTKSVDKATATPGETLVYTLSYSNTGDADATLTEITDVVPAFTTFASASDGGTEAAGVVTWSLGTIAAGASGSVTLTVTLDSVFPVGETTVTNSAVVVSPDNPPVPPTPDVPTVVTTVPPVANDDSDTTNAGTPVTTPVVGNDTDPDGTVDPTTVTVVTPPANGTVSVDPVTGDVTYTPTPGFFGTDIYTYTVLDNDSLVSNVATVTIDVNAPPLADDDSSSTDAGTPVTTPVVGNDTDPDGTVDPTTVTILANPGNGTVTVNPVTGDATYTPAPGFFGTDTYTYTVQDDDGLVSNVATVTIDVNAPPVADDDSSSTDAGTPVTTPVVGNDTDPDGTVDPTTVTVVANPSDGVVSVDPVTGDVTYTPNPGFGGIDTYTYTVLDDDGFVSNVATVTIDVNAPPVANDDSGSTDEDTPVTTPVVDNDTDPDGTVDPTTVTVVTPPTTGTVTVNPTTGEATYTPNPGFVGTDTYTYTVLDDDGLVSNVATVTITVLSVGEPELTLTKHVDKTEAFLGDALHYTLIYTNIGAGDATGVTVSDIVPDHTTFVSASNGGTLTAGTAMWTIGDLAAGASESLTLIVQISSTEPCQVGTGSNKSLKSLKSDKGGMSAKSTVSDKSDKSSNKSNKSNKSDKSGKSDKSAGSNKSTKSGKSTKSAKSTVSTKSDKSTKSGGDCVTEIPNSGSIQSIETPDLAPSNTVVTTVLSQGGSSVKSNKSNKSSKSSKSEKSTKEPSAKSDKTSAKSDKTVSSKSAKAPSQKSTKVASAKSSKSTKASVKSASKAKSAKKSKGKKGKKA
jgi:uncharacterized repeat protein (TIGR01451 family)